MDNFSAYLQAKIVLDDRSLNPEVWQHVCHLLKNRQFLDILDVGTGTGAMLCRVFHAANEASLAFTGVDFAAELLAVACSEMTALLNSKGFVVQCDKSLIKASAPNREFTLKTIATSVNEYQPGSQKFDLITAHAVMDLLPLNETVKRFKDWLKPGGLLFCSMNYDAQTVLFPHYTDWKFEQKLLKVYNLSMESRRTGDGQLTGGAYCGRRLFQELQNQGFKIAAYASSDWNITPLEGAYRDQDQLILACILHWVNTEGVNSSNIDPANLKRWFTERQNQLGRCELGMIIHQIDIFAKIDSLK